MQVAEILVRRTIRFVFFGGEGKKGPAAKEKSSKVEKKRRKEEKRTFHAGRRGFVTFSLSLSLSLSLVNFFRYFSSEPPLLGFLKDFVCKKKRKKGTRPLIGRRRPMGSLDFFFAWLFYLSTRETFVCSVFFSFSFHFPTPSRIGCRRRGQTNQEPRFIGSLLWARPMELCQQWETQ